MTTGQYRVRKLPNIARHKPNLTGNLSTLTKQENAPIRFGKQAPGKAKYEFPNKAANQKTLTLV